MLPPFISDTKDKHPTFILASYGGECYRHSFPTLKTNTRHIFLRHTESNVTAIHFRLFFLATKFPVRATKKLIFNDFSGPIEPPRKKSQCGALPYLCICAALRHKLGLKIKLFEKRAG